MAYHDLTLSFVFSFLIWTVFKVFTEFVTTLFLFSVLVFWPQGMWNLSFQTRTELTHPALEGSLNHWTSREVPWASSLNCFPVASGSSWHHSSLLIFIYPSCTSSFKSLYSFSVVWNVPFTESFNERHFFFDHVTSHIQLRAVNSICLSPPSSSACCCCTFYIYMLKALWYIVNIFALNNQLNFLF